VCPLQISSLDVYCSTVQGLLDWFEVDLRFTELLFIQIDLCVLCVMRVPRRFLLPSEVCAIASAKNPADSILRIAGEHLQWHLARMSCMSCMSSCMSCMSCMYVVRLSCMLCMSYVCMSYVCMSYVCRICLVWMSHGTYEGTMAHMNESCRLRMSRGM